MGNDQYEYQKQWRKEHPEKSSEYSKRYHDKRSSTLAGRESYNAYMRVKNKEYWHRIRNDALDLLGGKCIKCGYSDKRALQFDHINGGGTKDMKSHKSSYAYYKKVYESIRSGEQKFQILCANCNWIKRYENDER